MHFLPLGDSSYREELASLLSSDERDRADRFYFSPDCARFTTTRAALRLLLGRYLSASPQEIRFAYSGYGKPRLSEDVGVQFNVSHTKDMAMFAFTRIGEVGIDVERHRQVKMLDGMAERCLAAAQYEQFSSLGDEAKKSAFFRFWTRKEAVIKAVGLGLSQPLKDFDVSFLEGEEASLLRAEWDFGDVTEWSLHELEVSPEHQAAVAIRNRDVSVICSHHESLF